MSSISLGSPSRDAPSAVELFSRLRPAAPGHCPIRQYIRGISAPHARTVTAPTGILPLKPFHQRMMWASCEGHVAGVPWSKRASAMEVFSHRQAESASCPVHLHEYSSSMKGGAALYAPQIPWTQS